MSEGVEAMHNLVRELEALIAKPIPPVEEPIENALWIGTPEEPASPLDIMAISPIDRGIFAYAKYDPPSERWVVTSDCVRVGKPDWRTRELCLSYMEELFIQHFRR